MVDGWWDGGGTVYEVFTEAWAKAWCQALNGDAQYATAARQWEGALLLKMTPDPAYGIETPRAVWADLWHGRCREARVAREGDEAGADYVLEGPAAVWYDLLTGRSNPLAAILRGQLRLTKGNLMRLLPFTRAARLLVEHAVAIGTRFPKTPDPNP